MSYLGTSNDHANIYTVAGGTANHLISLYLANQLSALSSDCRSLLTRIVSSSDAGSHSRTLIPSFIT